MKPSEILKSIDDRHQRMEDRQVELLDKVEEIIKQTTETNGSVRNLKYTVYGKGESDGLINRTMKLEHWRSKLNGVWFAVLLSLTGIGSTIGIVLGILSLIK